MDQTYEERLKKEIEIFDQYEEVHKFPDIQHYWSNKYLLPKLKTYGFNSINDIYLHYMKSACKKKKTEICRFISIGAGHCEAEIILAKLLAESNILNFHFVCLDINQKMLDTGLESAKENGVDKLMSFVNKDLNYWKVQHKYDVILALQCLHHFVELEMIFDKIYQYLADDGFFLTHDMIGRNGHMRWPETRAVIDELWQQMPEKYRYHHQLKRLEIEFMDWDCSTEGFEGIRAQDIMPLLVNKFYFEFFIPWGGIIDVFINRGFGPNFNIGKDWDKNFIDKVAKINEELLVSGQIKPTQLFAAMQKYPPQRSFHFHGLSPEFCTRPV